MKYSKIPFQQPWRTPVYDVQCFTYKIAGDIAKDHRNVCSVPECHKPPFCLRILKVCRTPEMQQFRDAVAATVKKHRAKCSKHKLN